jgi:hypothetical protein
MSLAELPSGGPRRRIRLFVETTLQRGAASEYGATEKAEGCAMPCSSAGVRRRRRQRLWDGGVTYAGVQVKEARPAV